MDTERRVAIGGVSEIDNAVSDYLTTGKLAVTVEGWNIDELEALLVKLTPTTAMISGGPRSEEPGSVRHAHIHFQDPPTSLSAEEQAQYPHRVVITTFQTNHSDQGAFLHRFEFGQQRVLNIVGPIDLDTTRVLLFG